MCVLAKRQNHPGQTLASRLRLARLSKVVGSSSSVPGNLQIEGCRVVAVSAACQAGSIEANGLPEVVAVSASGFGRAAGANQTIERAAHITKPSTGRGVSSGPAKPGLFRGRAG